MNERSAYSRIFFLAAYTLCLFDAVIFGYSTYATYSLSKNLARGVELLAVGLIVIKLANDRFYRLDTILKISCISGLLAVLFMKSSYLHIFYLALLVAGMRDTDPYEVLNFDFMIKLILAIFVVVSSNLSIIGNYITQRTGEELLRLSMGFNHPNTLASITMSLVFEDYVLKERKGVVYNLSLLLITGIIYALTNNRTAVLIMLLFALVNVLIQSDAALRGGLIKKLFEVLYPICTAASFVLMKRCTKNRAARTIDRLLSHRMYNCLKLYNRYGIKTLGQKVTLISVRTARENNTEIALLDVSYLRALIQAGPVSIVIYTVLNFVAVKKAWEKNDVKMLVAIIVFIIFGFCESGANNVFINFTLIYAAAALYSEGELADVLESL